MRPHMFAALGLGMLLSLPAASIAATVTVGSPIPDGGNSNIDLTVYGNNTASYMDGNYTIYWKAYLSDPTPYLEIALDVKTGGWIGFGFADPASGGMKGSDIATITVVPNTTHYVTSLTDRYALLHALPDEDDVNNYNIKAGWQASDKSHTIVVFTRPLNTQDTQDRVISAGGTNVVMAFSADGSTTVSYHGPNKHAYIIEFFPDPNAPVVTEEALVWNYTTPPVNITTQETRYVCTGFTFNPPPLANGSAPSGHIIEITPLLDPNTTAWVHHYLIYSCDGTAAKYKSILNNPTECATNNVGYNDVCQELVFAWAVGSGPLIFPQDVGFSYGDANDPNSVRDLFIEVHYNNPTQQVVNIQDQSGISVKYITSKRKYDAGSVAFGDPLVMAPPMPFGSSRYLFEYTCPGECTQKWPAEVHAFASLLHSHSYGTQLVSTVTSNGITTDLGRADFYEFEFQHIDNINHTIKPGDRLNLHCNYDVSRNLFPSDPLRTNDTSVKFALGSEDEMCMTFFFYYPRLPNGAAYSVCGNYENNSTLCGFNANGIDVSNVTNPVVSGSSYADPDWILTKRFGLNSSAASALNASISATPGPKSTSSVGTSGALPRSIVGIEIMTVVMLVTGLVALL